MKSSFKSNIHNITMHNTTKNTLVISIFVSMNQTETWTASCVGYLKWVCTVRTPVSEWTLWCVCKFYRQILRYVEFPQNCPHQIFSLFSFQFTHFFFSSPSLSPPPFIFLKRDPHPHQQSFVRDPTSSSKWETRSNHAMDRMKFYFKE